MTNNLERRLKEHNQHENKSTKAYAPFTLIYSEAFDSRPSARLKEKYLKSGVGKAFLKGLIWFIAQVAKLVDALCSGRSVRKDVLVRIQSWAQSPFSKTERAFLFVNLTGLHALGDQRINLKTWVIYFDVK